MLRHLGIQKHEGDHSYFVNIILGAFKKQHTNKPIEKDPSHCAHLGSLTRPSGAAALHPLQESVRGNERGVFKTISSDRGCGQQMLKLKKLSEGDDEDHEGKSLYPSENAVNRLLVHVAGDSLLSQAGSDGAEVVQRCHPERHFCLLVAELVHLRHRDRMEGVLTAGDRWSRGRDMM